MPLARDVPQIDVAVQSCSEQVLRVRAEGQRPNPLFARIEPRHLDDVELAEAEHRFASKLDQIAARSRCAGQPGQVAQGVVAPAQRMTGS